MPYKEGFMDVFLELSCYRFYLLQRLPYAISFLIKQLSPRNLYRKAFPLFVKDGKNNKHNNSHKPKQVSIAAVIANGKENFYLGLKK